MVGMDGFAAGLALGKSMNDAEFVKAAELLRHRLKKAQESSDIEHPLHLGMIKTTNALITEIQELASNPDSHRERRLSDPNSNIHRVEHFREAAKEAQVRLSEGKIDLEFKSPARDIPPSAMVSSTRVELVPAKPAPAAGRPKR
jgi:hypothetical protein